MTPHELDYDLQASDETIEDNVLSFRDDDNILVTLMVVGSDVLMFY